MHIAKEGLKAQIPEPWKACRTKDQRIFYYNFETGESQWDHPLDKAFKERFLQLKFGEGKEENRTAQLASKKPLLTIQLTHQSPQEGEKSSKNSDLDKAINGSEMNFESSRDSKTKYSLSPHSNFLSEDIAQNFHENEEDSRIKDKSDKNKPVDSFDVLSNIQGEENNFGFKDLSGSFNNFSVKGKPDSKNALENSIGEDRPFLRSFNTEEDKKKRNDTLEEMETGFADIYQKYEDDLKVQFGYVISEFERNYQDNAAKIEEQYRREKKKIESELEKEIDGQDPNLEHILKEYEARIKGENDQDLKNQIEDVNRLYELNRKEMEERADKEIEECLQKVRQQCKLDINNITNVRHNRM